MVDEPVPARRRGLDLGSSSGPKPRTETLLQLPRPSSGGCSIKGMPAIVERLLTFQNRSQLMWLEIWGDVRQYRALQKVVYFIRTPRPAYVTLFWIGPNGDVFVPFDNLWVPGQRDVTVDPDSIIVPPLGRERWVAFATLERVHLPCGRGPQAQAALGRMMDAVQGLPHGVGRWEVVSAPHAPPPSPQDPPPPERPP